MISDILNNRNGIASYSTSGYGSEDELLQCLTPEPDRIDKATSSGTDIREILDEFEINIIEQGRSENEVDLTNHFQCTNLERIIQILLIHVHNQWSKKLFHRTNQDLIIHTTWENHTTQ